MNTNKETLKTPTISIEYPTNGENKAVVLLLHGLNLKPERMNDWATIFRSQGAYVTRFTLYGHQGSLEGMKDIDANMWRKQFKDALIEAQSLAFSEGLPLYFVGFSLGALIALEWLSHQEGMEQPIKKMVLIAPAIATSWYSKTAVSLLSFFGKNLKLPSRNPVEYRANNGSSLGAYQALFEIKDSLEKNAFKNSNVPTLVLIDKHDELVPSKAIKNIINERKLGQWTLDIVDNKFAKKNYGFRHLMVDEQSMGKVLWSSITEKVKEHLKL